MTKSELIDRLASRLPAYKRDDVALAVNVILETISATLAAGDRVEIRGFGSFSTHTRPGRPARNPKTGQRIEVPAKRVVQFKAGNDLRERVETAGRIKKRYTAKELTAQCDLEGPPVLEDWDRMPDVGRERIGVAKGKFEVPENIDGSNDKVARLFHGDAGQK